MEYKPCCSRARLRVLIVCIILLLLGLVLFLAIYFTTRSDDSESTSPETTPSPSSQNVYRLPTNLRPEHYSLKLRPDIYQVSPGDFRLYGDVIIRFLCQEVTSSVILHAVGLNISRDSLTVKTSGVDDGGSLQIKTWHRNDVRETLEIEMNAPFVKGERYDLQMTYTAPLTDKFQAVYYSKYTENGVTQYLATTVFVPTNARRAFPSFDEPAIKANFSVTVLRKGNFISLSNMPQMSSHNRTLNGEQWVADVFQESPPMSTYLVAFTVCRFKSIEANTTRGYKFITWSRPDSVNQTHFALDVGTSVLPYFDDYFGVPFPLPEQEMIAIPDFNFGGMEHWGLISYRETAMLYSSAFPSFSEQWNIARVIAHELAHMWFGDLLSIAWWDDVWLKEGFASYMEYEGVNSRFPHWKAHELFVVLALRPAFSTDAFELSRPLYKEVKVPDDIPDAFGSIIYDKGASIVRMVKFFLGNTTFVKGIQKYVHDFQYRSATHNDLWNSLNHAAEQDGRTVNVTDVMRSWTVQNNFPIVMVTREVQGSVKVSQSRYALNKSLEFEGDKKYKWDIPFTFTTTATHSPDVDPSPSDVKWIGRHQEEVTFDESSIPGPDDTEGWVLANIGAYGFYRVNYDDQNWNALINQLNTNHTKIHTSNRAQIIMDSWDLARIGRLNYTIALGTLGYLQREASYLPWYAALAELSDLRNMMSLEDPIYSEFSTFMQRQTEGVFLNFDPNAGVIEELDLRTPNLVAAQACRYGLPSCVSLAMSLFEAWRNNPTNNTIAVDIRNTIYCTAIANGTKEDWDFVFTRYLQPDETASETARLRVALTYSRDQDILRTLLDRVMNTTFIRDQDAIGTLTGISSNIHGTDLAWQFVKDNFNKLNDRFGSTLFSMQRLFSGVAAPFHTEEKLSELEQFLREHPDVLVQIRDAIEKTRANVEWVRTNRQLLYRWLQEQNGH